MAIERLARGIREFLSDDDLAVLNKEVAEKIMKKDKLDSAEYSYQNLGVKAGRQVGVIQREEEDATWKELHDGKLKKAARSRLGELQ